MGNKYGMDVSDLRIISSSRISENNFVSEMIFDVIGPSFGPLFSNYTYEEASNSAKQKFCYMLKVVDAP